MKLKKIKEFIRNNWKGIVRLIIILNAIFWMFAVAPFGYMFVTVYFAQLLRIITIFLATILLLYFLKDNK